MSVFKVVVVVCLLLFLSGCWSDARDDFTWSVLTLGAPVEISPDYSHSLLTSYVLKQTHEPLFRIDSNMSYYSNVLDRWERSVDSKSVKLCIDQPKKFYKDESFDTSQLRVYLIEILKKLSIDGMPPKPAGDCLVVNFPTGQAERFLHELSLLKNAPTMVSASNVKVHWGLGSYFVKTFMPEKVVLKRKERLENAFDTIEFLNLNNVEFSSIDETRIEDFNYLPPENVPDWVKESYTRVQHVPLKIAALVLNIEDPSLRKKVYHCLGVERLREAIFGKTFPFINIATILPTGVLGGQAGLPVQSCDVYKKIKVASTERPLRFANWKGSHESRTARMFESFSEEIGVPIKTDFLTFNELNEIIYEKPDSYDLLVIKVDTKTASPAPFFEAFVDPQKSIVRHRLPLAHKWFKELVTISDDAKVVALARKIQAHLQDGAYLLPLFQEKRMLYYPKDVEGVYLGDDYLMMPEIRKIRVKK